MRTDANVIRRVGVDSIGQNPQACSQHDRSVSYEFLRMMLSGPWDWVPCGFFTCAGIRRRSLQGDTAVPQDDHTLLSRCDNLREATRRYARKRVRILHYPTRMTTT
jgi:hypothetical protein